MNDKHKHVKCVSLFSTEAQASQAICHTGNYHYRLNSLGLQHFWPVTHLLFTSFFLSFSSVVLKIFNAIIHFFIASFD